jgi:hypothetical protein
MPNEHSSLLTAEVIRPNFTRIVIGDAELWFSYRTLVAFRHPSCGIVCIKNYWKTTTGKHLNEIQPDHTKRIGKEQFDELYYTIFRDNGLANGGAIVSCIDDAKKHLRNAEYRDVAANLTVASILLSGEEE